LSTRIERRRFRRDASSSLLTYLVEPGDLRPTSVAVPILRDTARNWLDLLSTRVRNCIVCDSWVTSGQCVGALLLATPATAKPTSASCCAICME